MCNPAVRNLKRLFLFGILFGLVLVMTGCPWIGEEQPAPFDPSDKPLVEFLDLTAADLEACPGILSQQAVPGVTFRDLVQSQYEASQELRKAKATEQYVDTVKIYDELLDVFWETVTIPIDMITGGVIDAYGTDALKELWQIKKSLSILKPATVTMELSELFVAILEVKQDQAFLANQTAIYLHYVSEVLPAGAYDREDFTLAHPVDERIHEDVWTTYAVAKVGDESYLFVPGYRVTHPANADRFSSTFVKWLTKEAWRLAYANHLLHEDKEKLREQILSACHKPPETRIATPSPTTPPSTPSPVATIVRETPTSTPIPTPEPTTTRVEEPPTPTPASEVIATKLMTVPLEPDQELVGSCWTGSIALPLPHAWRCSSDNRIYDPCLSDSPTDTFVICTGNPFNPLNRVEKLNLTEPLPVSQANRVLTLVVWRLELADGAQCNYILWPTGTLPEDVALMMGAGIKFKCNDGWYVTNLSGGSPAEYIPAPGVWTTSEVRVDPNVWIALKVYWDGYQITEAIEVPITTVWY